MEAFRYPEKAEIGILVVDDNTLTRTLIAGLVRREGVQRVATAKSGGEAIELFPAVCPLIVFLDIDMDDMDGFKVLHAVKQFGTTAQVVMVSATATPARVKAAREGGAASFLVKPVSQGRIGDAIHACIERAVQEEGSIELFAAD